MVTLPDHPWVDVVTLTVMNDVGFVLNFAVDVQDTVPHLKRVARHPNETLDQHQVGLMRRIEDEHIAPAGPRVSGNSDARTWNL